MHMQFVQNVPFFSIMLCMVCGIVSAVLPARVAKWVTVGLAAAVAATISPTRMGAVRPSM